jgi:phosphate transport system substrate-binding protein
MNEMSLKKQVKLILSVILGIGITVLSFLTFVLLIFSPQGGILSLLLIVFYISTITFLVLWNKNKSKSSFIPLAVSAMCAAIAVIIIRYNNYVHTVPSVEEGEVNLYLYKPFNDRQTPAKLDESADYRVIDNVPVLDGATALYPVYAAFVNAVYPENEYDPKDSAVLCGKTTDAYNNLLDGKVDIIFCAGPSEEQMRQFLERNIKITLIPIGKEAFVFFVNGENNVDNLTTDDVKNIYSGKINNWKNLGGMNKSIRVYQRPDNSGSQTALKNIMGTIPLLKPRRENISSGMGGIINRVAAYRNFNNAIGYSFLHFSTGMVKNDQIKLLSINGIYPSKETIGDDSYPFCDAFYAIYAERDDMNENIKPFIAWILSKQGQELIEKTGYVPMNNGKPPAAAEGPASI